MRDEEWRGVVVDKLDARASSAEYTLTSSCLAITDILSRPAEAEVLCPR